MECVAFDLVCLALLHLCVSCLLAAPSIRIATIRLKLNTIFQEVVVLYLLLNLSVCISVEHQLPECVLF